LNRRGKVVRFTTTVDDSIDVGFDDASMDDSCLDHASRSKGLLHSIEATTEHSLSREEIRIDDYLHNRRGNRPPFKPVEIEVFADGSSGDPIIVDGTRKKKEVYHSITVMRFYENESFEELRMEDYKVGRKGKKLVLISSVADGGDDVSASSPSSRPKNVQLSGLFPRQYKIPNPYMPSSGGFHFAAPSSSLFGNSLPVGQPSPSLKSAHMIYVRVAVGVSTTGKPSYTRPPPICEEDLSRGRYNSCFGSLDGKSVVVIFENAQAYPEYIVKYEMDEEFFT